MAAGNEGSSLYSRELTNTSLTPSLLLSMGLFYKYSCSYTLQISCLFSGSEVVSNTLTGSRLSAMSRNKQQALRWGFYTFPWKPSCPRLLIRCICIYLPYLEAVVSTDILRSCCCIKFGLPNDWAISKFLLGTNNALHWKLLWIFFAVTIRIL